MSETEKEKVQEEVENTEVDFMRLIEDKQLLKGQVVLTESNNELLNADVIKIHFECKGNLYEALMSRDEINILPVRYSLIKLLGASIEFRIIDIIDNQLIASRKAVQKDLQTRLIEKLKEGKTITATFTSVKNFGGILNFCNIPMILRNKDFSTDYTRVIDVYEKGQKIDVKLCEVNEYNNKIFVEPIEKYRSTNTPRVETYNVDQVVTGTVVSVTAFGVFVRLAPGLDSLCSVPLHFTVDKDDQVQYRIISVNPEKQH
jgi:small subunit ribosomal protein S1